MRVIFLVCPLCIYRQGEKSKEVDAEEAVYTVAKSGESARTSLSPFKDYIEVAERSGGKREEKKGRERFTGRWGLSRY